MSKWIVSIVCPNCLRQENITVDNEEITGEVMKDLDEKGFKCPACGKFTISMSDEGDGGHIYHLHPVISIDHNEEEEELEPQEEEEVEFVEVNHDYPNWNRIVHLIEVMRRNRGGGAYD